jgi:hypothetical protein
MSIKITKNSLGIFWEGEEVDGILVYGYWDSAVAEEPVFPNEVWESNAEWKTSELHDEKWSVWLWQIRVLNWPSTLEWIDRVRKTLEAMRTGRAKVSWCGIEGFFSDPPKLFDSAEMSGGVWAVLGVDGVLYGPPPLDGVFLPIPDSLLDEIRKKYIEKKP